MKILYLLSVVACASVVLAQYQVKICDNTCRRKYKFNTPNNLRACICLRSTQTGTIEGNNGGLIRIFSSNDCTGDFKEISPNGIRHNAQWVNSMSFGPPGSSRSPGTCPAYY
ncbi:hypothetical protein BG015_007886 [Linnemannia schmuckeri]|uniref:Uncharacterized protein n=1 Tax=Linnemannia schmuckeri TaxID=64567 RepID=A0A9P5S0I7_9FUNG|nr:hypothetical protein BG015_007886 [Linnemannia schmuckeri]